MQYKVITYFDNMEDDVEIYDNKDEAIKRVHHLRGVKYRNLKLYKVEMEEVEQMARYELFNDHFENAKRYQIPRAQLIIADIPYNLGNNAYACDPRWY